MRENTDQKLKTIKIQCRRGFYAKGLLKGPFDKTRCGSLKAFSPIARGQL